MPFKFEVLATSGAGRRGRLLTPHGPVETPVFMPVGTVASVKGVPQEVLEELGVEILLGNTYHLYLRPGVEQVQALGGLHRFMSWPRAILTDSGGFQVFSLRELRAGAGSKVVREEAESGFLPPVGMTSDESEQAAGRRPRASLTEEGVTFRSHLDGSSHFFSPESAMAAQIGLGADVIMAFDECTEYPADPERVRASMELTARWAARSKQYFEDHKHQVPWAEKRNGHDERQALFGIVQGGMDRELRRESAERTIEIGFPGYAMGGLSVGEPRELTREVVESTLEHLPQNKPRYLMGVGTPDEIVEYAQLGVDMMDCVLPTRAARHGLLFTSEGKISIKQTRYAGDQGPLDPNCACSVCRRYSRAYLRHLYATHEVLAQVLNTVHNLAYYLDTMRRVRHAIEFGERLCLASGVPQQP